MDQFYNELMDCVMDGDDETALHGLVLVDLPLGGLLKHTEMLFLGFLLRTLAAALVVLLYWMALVLFFPYTLPLLLITGGWLPGVLAVQILYPALDQAYGLTQRDADIEQEKR